MDLMFSKILGKNKNIVKIRQLEGIQGVPPNIIYQALENSRCISQSKGHNQKLKLSCLESRFPFITFSDPNQMISVVQVQLGINGGPLKGGEG